MSRYSKLKCRIAGKSNGEILLAPTNNFSSGNTSSFLLINALAVVVDGRTGWISLLEG
jgi:hypothetical protein